MGFFGGFLSLLFDFGDLFGWDLSTTIGPISSTTIGPIHSTTIGPIG